MMKNKHSNHSNNYPVIDERLKKSIGDVSTIIVVVTIIYLLVEAFYKYVTTKNILTTTWEIALLLLIVAIFLIGIKSNKEMTLPTSFLGKQLPTSQSIEAKRNRIKAYLIESVVTSAVITGLTFFFEFIGIEVKLSLSEYIASFLGLMVVYLILSYLLGEHNIKKYNKYMEELEK
ncbi:hypothetical protein [Streptococcus zalophi]|uniref:DUF3278 domain-containing protein n=1 Tax=Streptococcus zalophi TaxID=640031 RepID=A0A934UDB4_9STRE|nr:hypothetical protein [Streptococcus zalophi]MBJ8349484.1 hypothetical protein [Streptococcus zalophi]